MFSSARGMAICIGVTGVASILLWFYFKNRIENVESKLDSMFVMIQNFSEESSPNQETQVYNERIDDPFENRDLQYFNEMESKQLPQEESNENVKLITVSDNEGEKDNQKEEEESESEEESDGESDGESEVGSEEEEEEEEQEEEEEEKVEVVKKTDETIKSINLDLSDGGDSLDDMDSDEDIKKAEVEEEVKEYSSMKVSELKSLCSEKGLSGYTKLNKAGLVNLLENN